MVSRIWKRRIYIWYENVNHRVGVGLLKRVLVFEEKKREGGQRYTSRHLKNFFQENYRNIKV
jgi:hypothetical protein